MRLFMSSRGVTWDQSTVTDASVDEDIDPALVRRFLLAARSERRWEVPDETSMDRVLRQLGLIVRRGGGRNYWYELRDSGDVPQGVPQDPMGNRS